jgi:hypothetical protein
MIHRHVQACNILDDCSLLQFVHRTQREDSTEARVEAGMTWGCDSHGHSGTIREAARGSRVFKYVEAKNLQSVPTCKL